MRLIDADALDSAMYHKSFEVDDGRNIWNSGLWIRYRIYEEASREAPTVDAVPVEYILKQIAKLERSKGQSYHAICYRHLIEVWEMENERKEE